MPAKSKKRPHRVDERSRTDRTKQIRKRRANLHSWVQCTYCYEYSLSDKIKRHYKRPDHAQASVGYVAMPKGFHPKLHGNLSQREDEPQETNNRAVQ